MHKLIIANLSWTRKTLTQFVDKSERWNIHLCKRTSTSLSVRACECIWMNILAITWPIHSLTVRADQLQESHVYCLVVVNVHAELRKGRDMISKKNGIYALYLEYKVWCLERTMFPSICAICMNHLEEKQMSASIVPLRATLPMSLIVDVDLYFTVHWMSAFAPI